MLQLIDLDCFFFSNIFIYILTSHWDLSNVFRFLFVLFEFLEDVSSQEASSVLTNWWGVAGF